MTLEECIVEIISNFKKNDYFDSHAIINELIMKPKYHIVYLQEYSKNCTINQYHGKIAKIISSSNSCIPIGNSKSHTIYDEISDNELWQKK